VTESELAYLALGLLLGAATTAALTLTFGTRLARREIRVTVTRDAVPRRSGTLSQGAFSAHPGEPARGGPGDRREVDRDDAGPAGPPASTPQPGAAPAPLVGIPIVPDLVPDGLPNRTSVSFEGASGGPGTPSPVPVAVPAPAAVVEARRTAVGLAAEPEATAVGSESHAGPHGSALERMLRGEHRAMLEVVDALAGPAGQHRRDWELLLGGLVDAMAASAVREAVIDFPLGTAFWDTFTVEQCRRIVLALDTMGFRYDGDAGWAEGRVPTYRHLSQALADIGVDPRRIRAWPNQSDIAALFIGARPAPEELLPAAGPDYGVAEMQALVGETTDGLADLWLAWDEIRLTLLAEPARADEELAVES